MKSLQRTKVPEQERLKNLCVITVESLGLGLVGRLTSALILTSSRICACSAMGRTPSMDATRGCLTHWDALQLWTVSEGAGMDVSQVGSTLNIDVLGVRKWMLSQTGGTTSMTVIRGPGMDEPKMLRACTFEGPGRGCAGRRVRRNLCKCGDVEGREAKPQLHIAPDGAYT